MQLESPTAGKLEMADVGLNDRCLLPSCSSTSSGSLKTFKIQAFKKLLECAVERGDDETLDKLRTIFNCHRNRQQLYFIKVVTVPIPRKNMSRSLL